MIRMIVISKKKYWKQIGYHDGLLYCSMLSIDGHHDWRIFRDEEEFEYEDNYKSCHIPVSHVWLGIDTEYDYDLDDSRIWLIPIRDVKIELIDKQYWTDNKTYVEMLDYLSEMGDDWRLPTFEEVDIIEKYHPEYGRDDLWVSDDMTDETITNPAHEEYTERMYFVVLVKDI